MDGYNLEFIKRECARKCTYRLHLLCLIVVVLPRMYNAITRSMESELVPCARKFGLRIVIYNPLAYVPIFSISSINYVF